MDHDIAGNGNYTNRIKYKQNKHNFGDLNIDNRDSAGLVMF